VGEVIYASKLSGLWYDPTLDGEGFNVLVADAGMVVFFYGHDTNDERLWLASDTITGEFVIVSSERHSVYFQVGNSYIIL
jgi:hypothetical protein